MLDDSCDAAVVKFGASARTPVSSLEDVQNGGRESVQIDVSAFTSRQSAGRHSITELITSFFSSLSPLMKLGHRHTKFQTMIKYVVN